ncbi:MAG: hypothetical protein JSR46_00900, partial [Verrucomicrobia bacterium]|nr:hypothetical protein [Verrucomicrobiota bacterium]
MALPSATSGYTQSIPLPIDSGPTTLETTHDCVVGVGMPTVDFLYLVKDSFLTEHKIEKESVQCVDREDFERFLKLFQTTPKLATGGCCSNTIKALCRLKMKTSISGRLGSDSHAQFYKAAMEALGATVRSVKTVGDTQQIAVMVTPDHKRSCVAHLGVGASFCRADI